MISSLPRKLLKSGENRDGWMLTDGKEAWRECERYIKYMAAKVNWILKLDIYPTYTHTHTHTHPHTHTPIHTPTNDWTTLAALITTVEKWRVCVSC